jgi:hypothetical protein
MSRLRPNLSSLPWLIALAGLALPMIGSGFIGWPIVVGWLVLLLLVWWVRPIGGADRRARIVTGILAIGVLAVLATLGGLYLIPAVIAWLVLVATSPAQGGHADLSMHGQSPRA